MSLLKKTYPETWRINDWDNPWLPFPIRVLNRLPIGLTQAFYKLDEQSLLDYAKNATGLHDFGNEAFLPPLRLVLDDIAASTAFTTSGIITAQSILQMQLQARLCIEHAFKHCADLSSEEVRSPIFIAGLPRTGTTHLHNLLSQVTGLRYLPLWQTLEPVLNPNLKKDNRRAKTDFKVWMGNYLLPLFERMHEMETDMPHEELTLSAFAGRSFIFECTFQTPTYRKWYAANEQVEGYEYLKKILQIVQREGTQAGKTDDARWILKSPQHVDQLHTILKVFPDAKIALTHRDPARAVLSMITMMIYTSRQMYKPVQRKQLARAWADRLEQMLRSSAEQARQLSSDQLIHVHFDEFMKNPENTISNVLEFANVTQEKASREAIKHHLETHTRDKNGRIDYQYEDFGFTEEGLREQFAGIHF